MMKNNFNIYTAIVYASQKPHIGNTYEIILADAIARFKRSQGYDVYLQTGTDEHGQKIEKKALENNQDPQSYVDSMSDEVKKIWQVVNSSHDRFVRTSDENHKKAVGALFEKLYQQGDIYKGKYKGLYCVPCESFWKDNETSDNQCPDCGRPVDYSEEEAYFLKLSKYADRLKQHINENPEFIQPESRKNEIVNQFLKEGLDDLCVSRSSLKWGIPVTFDKNHVIYVWLDALTNYITFIGYNGSEATNDFAKYWPADVHVIGKDIMRFHSIYWPIILMALDLPLPKVILGHPWVLMESDKMSKSKGNLVYADELVDYFGVDEVRYYFLSQISFVNDGVFSYDLLIDKINADLANNVGNLVNRTLKMVEKYFQKQIPQVTEYPLIDQQYQEQILKLEKKVIDEMERYYVADAIGTLLTIFDAANKYIDTREPWRLARENEKELAAVMYNLLETIYRSAILLAPFMPLAATKIFTQLNVEERKIQDLAAFGLLESQKELGEIEPLFLRINKVEKLSEIV